MKRLIHNNADGHSATETKCIDQEVVLAFDSSNRPLYIARADPGAASTDSVWQICKNIYDSATGAYIGYVFANSDNGYCFQASNYAAYTYTSPVAGTLGNGNLYNVTLTTSTTTTTDIFKPHDGNYSIYISGTWTGAVTLERRLSAVSPAWQPVNSFNQNIQTIGTHAGGSAWEYRFEFTTPTSGSVVCVMSQA